MSSNTKINKDLREKIQEMGSELNHNNQRKVHVLLNTYVNSYHEKLCIDSKTTDQNVPKAAQTTLIDYGQLQN
jgi:hypothetical protein